MKTYILRKTILKELLKTPLSKGEIADFLHISPEEASVVISDLVKYDNAYLSDGKYYPAIGSFFREVTETDLSDSEKSLIMERMLGKTLEDIAKERGMSKEGIRLSENRVFDKIQAKYGSKGYIEGYNTHIYLDNFYEDVFRGVRFDPAFIDYLKEKANMEILSARYYIEKHKARFKYSERLSLIDRIDNFFDLPETLKEEIIGFYNPVIMDTGYVSRKFDIKVILELLKKYGPIPIKRLNEMYITGEHLYYSCDKDKQPKYFQCTILESDNIIRSDNKGLLRYYDIEKYQGRIEALIPIIREVLKDFSGKVNIYYIFKKLEKDLQKIGIYNKYELHSLLRKLDIPDIKISRMPYLYVR